MATHRYDPDTRRRQRAVYRRRRTMVFVVGGLGLLILVYLIGVVIAPLPSANLVHASVKSASTSAANLQWPDGAQAAVMAPDYPQVASSAGGTSAVPIASITKVVTALVVLDRKPIAAGQSGPSLTFTENDVDIWNEVVADGGSWAPVVAGTSMTERQALAAMLVPSGSNYAISLANWAFGSTSAYVSAAKSWLAKHGLSGTTIVSPDGLDPGNESTTKDLLRLGQMVLASPVLVSIVSEKATENLPGAGVQQNTNQLLGVDGIDGIKTGNTDPAGYCLLFSARLSVGTSSVRIVGVVLGAPDITTLWSDVSTLVTSVRSGFHDVTLTEKGHVFGSYTTPWGAHSSLVAASSEHLIVWSRNDITSRIAAHPLVTGTAGTSFGTVTFTVGSTTKSIPLVLESTVPGPSFLWRLAHPYGFGA